MAAVRGPHKSGPAPRLEHRSLSSPRLMTSCIGFIDIYYKYIFKYKYVLKFTNLFLSESIIIYYTFIPKCAYNMYPLPYIIVINQFF